VEHERPPLARLSDVDRSGLPDGPLPVDDPTDYAMIELVVLATFAALLVGVALGWYLRRINAWCPQCGNVLTCPGCGGRPTWSSPGRARKPAR